MRCAGAALGETFERGMRLFGAALLAAGVQLKCCAARASVALYFASAASSCSQLVESSTKKLGKSWAVVNTAVFSPDGQGPRGNVMYEKGTTHKGVVLDTRRHRQQFNGNFLHFSMEVRSGVRYGGCLFKAAARARVHGPFQGECERTFGELQSPAMRRDLKIWRVSEQD